MMLELVLFIMGGLLILYYIVSTLALGSVPFSTVLLVLGIVLVTLGVLDRKFGHLGKIVQLKKVLIPIAVVALICFAALEAVVITGVVQKDRAKVDYIVVLGAGLRGDQLSLTLRQRLDAALACEQGETIVVTGGQGWNEAIPEAVAMRRYLMEQGVSEDQILMEDKSTNTNENLDHAKELIEAHSGKELSDLQVKIISSDYHCFRAKMIARRHGYTQVTSYGAGTHPLLIPTFYIREGLALAKSFLFDR